MKIDKSKLHVGIWYTDDEGNRIPNKHNALKPDGAVYAHVCFPLEIREEIYRLNSDGGYGDKDKVMTGCCHLSRSTGQLAVAMVNSGDYDLYEALAVLAQCCERCCNVLWNKYLSDVDGYPEYSEEWKRCNTVCEFCENEVKIQKDVEGNGDVCTHDNSQSGSRNQ